jgi:Tfp pilus assembly protein PilV
MKNRSNSQGFSLIELLVYLASMLLVVAAISYAMINVYGVYVSMTSAARADRAAGTLMQILATELRTGATIDQANSVFNSSQGQLTITAYDGVSETEKVFRLASDRVILETDGVETLMTPADMQASKLLFTQIVTPLSYAVRYEIDITYSVQGELVTKTYPGLVIMRRSYD